MFNFGSWLISSNFRFFFSISKSNPKGVTTSQSSLIVHKAKKHEAVGTCIYIQTFNHMLNQLSSNVL